MNVQIQEDFYNFLANKKDHISPKDIEDFEVFIQRVDFEDIHEELNDFINEFLDYYIKKNDKRDNIPNQELITKKKKPISYKQLYKRNLENKIKRDYKTSSQSSNNLYKLDKNENMKINFESFKEHVTLNDYNTLFLKFMTKVNALLINKKLFGEENKSKVKRIKKTKDNVDKSEIYYSDNSNINKSNNVSDIDIKCKENFLNVLQNITKNVLVDIKNKELPIEVEENVVPDYEKVIKSKSEDNTIVKSKSNEHSVIKSKREEIVKDSEIHIIINEKVENTNKINENELNKNKNKEKIFYSDDKLCDTNTKPKLDVTDKKTVKKKDESCNCRCEIY